MLCKRKKVIDKKSNKDALVQAIQVKSLGKGNYYGFTLDGNHKYILHIISLLMKNYAIKLLMQILLLKCLVMLKLL